MEIISKLISYDLAEPLGWTILHSLWQGLLIATGIYLIHKLTMDKYANFKYWISVTGMLVFFSWSIHTYNHYSTKVEFTRTIKTFQGGDITLGSKINNFPVHNNLSNNTITDRIERTFSFFEGKIPLIVLLWFSGIVVFSTRLMFGMVAINKLKKFGINKVDSTWHEFFVNLTRKIGLKRKVYLFESVKIDIPMVLGFIKPVILVPVGFFSNLTPQQVEAVLVHELSHVKRHDFLVNIIQSVFEVMFFFNPFVWWMSKSVREEREHCCDDLAISICKDPIAYGRALTTIQEARLPRSGLAIGLANNKNHLLVRIKRLVGHSSRSAKSYDKIITATILLMTLMISYFYGQKVFSIQPEYGQMREASLGYDNTSLEKLDYLQDGGIREIASLPTIPKLYPINMATKLPAAIIWQDTGKSKIRYKELLQSIRQNEIMREEMMQRMQQDMMQMQEEMMIMQKQELLKLTDYFSEMKQNEELEDLTDQERLELKKSLDLSRRKLEKMVQQQRMTKEEEFLRGKTMRLKMFDEQLMRAQEEMAVAKEKFARIQEGEMKEEMEKMKDKMKVGMEKMKVEMKLEIEKMKVEMAKMEKKHKAFTKELREELVKDGYLKNTTERFEMEIDDEDVYINHEKIKEKDAKKYIKIKNKYFEDNGGTFRIQHE